MASLSKLSSIAEVDKLCAFDNTGYNISGSRKGRSRKTMKVSPFGRGCSDIAYPREVN